MNLPNLAQTTRTRTGPNPGPTPLNVPGASLAQADLFFESTSGSEIPLPQHPAAHALKALLMEALLHDHPGQRLLQITAKVPQACLQAWHLVAHTLLARRLDAAGPPTAHGGGLRDNAHTVAWALQRQWEQPLLAQRWERLLGQLSPTQCERLVKQVRRQIRAH